MKISGYLPAFSCKFGQENPQFTGCPIAKVKDKSVKGKAERESAKFKAEKQGCYKKPFSFMS
jgi:hypothetical protein